MLDTLLKHLDMVRLSVGAAAILVLVGCTGLIEGKDDPGVTPEEQAARDQWVNQALPAFQSATCVTCHQGQQGAAVAFLSGTSDLDIRNTLLTFDPQVVNLDAAQSSRVLTKGAHAGPALDAQYVSPILTWIQAEQAAAGAAGGGGTTTLTTMPFTPLLCTSGTSGSPTCPINHVGLADVGMSATPPIDLTGAEITFVVQPLSNSMYVTDLTLVAGASGIYIEHPLFVYLPATGLMCADGTPSPCPDNIDRYFATKLDVKATMVSEIEGGTAAFTGFAPITGSQMQISFKVVDVYRADTGGGGGGTTVTGCKVLTGANSFQTLVVPVMNVALTGEGNKCSGCHLTGQNQNAISAMDLTGIGSTDTTAGGALNTACNQVLTRINMQDIPNSGVILAPESGQDAAHPFKFASGTNFTNFQTALVNWANAEKVAP
jgi:hypothetical protein